MCTCAHLHHTRTHTHTISCVYKHMRVYLQCGVSVRRSESAASSLLSVSVSCCSFSSGFIAAARESPVQSEASAPVDITSCAPHLFSTVCVSDISSSGPLPVNQSSWEQSHLTSSSFPFSLISSLYLWYLLCMLEPILQLVPI